MFLRQNAGTRIAPQPVVMLLAGGSPEACGTLTPVHQTACQSRNVPLGSVVVTDDNGTPGDTSDDFNPTFVDGDTDGDGLLDTDETWEYEATGTAAAGQYRNVSDVVGNPVQDDGTDIPGLANVTDSDPSHYFGQVQEGGEGCTPGFWKQCHHLKYWVGYSPEEMFDDVFGVDAPGDLTLLETLKKGGGGLYALGRHAVAALLNAASPDVDYLYTEAEVIAMVQNAYATGQYEEAKDLLEAQNEAGCSLGGPTCDVAWRGLRNLFRDRSKDGRWSSYQHSYKRGPGSGHGYRHGRSGSSDGKGSLLSPFLGKGYWRL